jgi:hypothetical protein
VAREDFSCATIADRIPIADSAAIYGWRYRSVTMTPLAFASSRVAARRPVHVGSIAPSRQT